jgi:Peptidase family C78
LCGTEHWIGATECAALLRYFGIRAVIVDFSMDKEERTNRAAKLKLTLARRNKTLYNKKRRKNDEGYPLKKYVKCKNIKISQNRSTSTVAAIGTNSNINIDRYDNQSDDDFENNDGAVLLNGNGIKNDSSLHGNTSINNDVHHHNASQHHREGYQELNSTCKSLNSDILMNQDEQDDLNRIDEEEKNSYMSMSERVFNWVKRYHAFNKVITDAGSVAMGGGVSCNQVKRSVLIPCNNVINIDLEDDDDIADDNNNGNDNNNHNNSNNSNGNNKNSNNSNNAARSNNNNDKKKGKSTSVLPLFFQHQGHSRTIIGTESFKKNCLN